MVKIGALILLNVNLLCI